jgi:prepilin-type N-terminal cleavage/methylation domain-containing protein
MNASVGRDCLHPSPQWIQSARQIRIISGGLPKTDMKLGPNKASEGYGFNLVELLVVIAIIAILAALLLTALNTAKLKGLQTKCLSNVKQLSLMSFMYASDNGKHAGYNNPDYKGGAWMGSLIEYARDNSLRTCPSAPLPRPYATRGNGQGTADKAWVRWTDDGKTMFYGSYGYNGWLYSDGQIDNTGVDRDNYRFLFRSEASIQKPDQTPVFFDENWLDQWPLENDPPSRDLYNGRSLYDWGNNMARCTIARHGGRSPASAPRDLAPGEKLPGAINMGMADGHSQLVKLEDLWKLSWHLDWQPPATRPR